MYLGTRILRFRLVDYLALRVGGDDRPFSPFAFCAKTAAGARFDEDSCLGHSSSSLSLVVSTAAQVVIGTNVAKKRKQPYAIALADPQIMALAGLWETWRSPAGERIRSFAIVTTTP